MKIIDVSRWDRKEHFEHFMRLRDPTFAVTIPFDVSRAYAFAKANNISFFAKYLHDCMLALNAIENFRYRILAGQVVEFEIIHASTTIIRENNTFGFSLIPFNFELDEFAKSYQAEKVRIQSTQALFPSVNGLDCIYCSVLPWFKFSGHKEAVAGDNESVPKLAFSKAELVDEKRMMNVAINVNHALVDGYHVGLFSKYFQDNLDRV